MKKLISFLLALVLLCGLLPAAVPVSAAADDQTATENGGLKLNKTAEYDEDNDQYWITLEAYATGTSTTINTAAPVDFVLVLDQSGSMADAMSTSNYNAYTGNERQNSNLYTKRHDTSNNQSSRNLHYKDGSTYYPVYVTRSQTYVYTALPATTTNTTYYSKRNNLYADSTGATKVDVSWDIEDWSVTYTYKVNGTTYTSSGRETVPSFITDGTCTFYERSTVNTYTYTYVKNNATYTIGTSTGDDTLFTDKTLYSYTSDTSTTRLESMMSAANTFADSVHKKAVEDNLNHRVAVVGFASDTSTYRNTEVLTGVTVESGNYIQNNGPSTGNSYYYYPEHYNYQGTQYGDRNINTAYKNALQNMNTDAGYENVTNAIGYLTARGGTQTDHGLAMAKGIFGQNPIAAGENRKRVVVLLTDGIPTGNSNRYDSTVFDDAKDIADDLKDKDQYNAIIYTIGIFDGANAEKAGSVGIGSSDADKGNYVCQWLSSNNGTPPTSGADSYYLSASTQESLNKIFLKIAGELKTTTSASTELGTATTVQDVVAPQFQLPNDFDASKVELKTYPCNGVDSSGNPTFSSTANADAMGAVATIDTNGKLNVTGFDYKENWCGQATDASGTKTYCGNKLVIRFPVKVKDGFLGGNDVYTNTEAKVYPSPEDAALGADAVGTFPRPHVNVPIGTITVTTTDKNVYLTQIPEENTLKSGITVKCGNVDITDPSQLESWQTEYVTITTDVTTPTDFDATTDDTGSVTVKVTPNATADTTKPGKVATEQTGTGTYKINVFKPELTFTDGEVWYGDTAPTDYTDNLTKTVWKHGSDEADETMGEAPKLTITYTPDADKIVDNKVATKSDIPVKATVSIGNKDVTEYTTFVHGTCNVDGCTWNEAKGDENGDPAFLLHVKTCSLTIKKTGNVDGNDYFVFDIKQDGKAYTQATIKGTGSVTITGLPVGTYDVSEDGSTAWRYESTLINSSSSVTLSSTDPDATVTCTNTKTENKWLNDFTRVTNIYGATSGEFDGNN